jgi:hypothetical protein
MIIFSAIQKDFIGKVPKMSKMHFAILGLSVSIFIVLP